MGFHVVFVQFLLGFEPLVAHIAFVMRMALVGARFYFYLSHESGLNENGINACRSKKPLSTRRPLAVL